MAKPVKDPLVGTRIREYEILDQIGRGGMGAVYRARHVYLDEERAIKVIQSRLAGDKDFVERFIREAKILTKLRHPNLVQLFEFGTLEEDVFFMVLEFIRGEGVLQRIQRLTRIPIGESIRIVREAAQGLHSAHQRGIIHRDISPDNLLLVKDDLGNETTKVIDFGIAKPMFEGTRHFTMTGAFIGKPQYCSPEQCGMLEEGEEIDRRSDIYSLAITFYQMLVGKLPFYSTSPQGYIVKQVNETPKPPSTHFGAGEFPVALDQIILKALAKDRKQRHSTLEEFIRELDQVDQREASTIVRTVAARPPGADLQPGETFSRRYLIEKKLGEGGMGTVYKAIDKILEVSVALKIMSPKIVHDEKAVERFKREVLLARKVAHPNACRIYDIGESAGVHYVSMEYLDGTTLAEMLRTHGRLSADDGIPIVKQTLLALEEAHRVGVIHRDLKPQNIMVDSTGRAHIMDFGISTSAEVHRLTQTGQVVGTPHYMAPEQFEDAHIDHRADIYAMGIMMYEMFTGKLPFTASSPIAVIFLHLKSKPARPSEIVPDIPPELENIILKALEKEQQSRFQTVRELLQALEPMEKATTVVTTKREAMAHRLIAERKYTQAIKCLKSLLGTEPGNTEWIKLLRNARQEKAKRDLRHARSLIQKKNLIQAQSLLARLERTFQRDPKVTTHVRRLEAMLEEERERAIQEYLQQADSLLESKDFMAAAAQIESALNLKPNDERIVAWQRRLQQARQEELERSLRAQLEEARAAVEQGKEDEGLERVEQIVKEHPSFEPAAQVRDEILAARARRAEEERIRQTIDAALQALAGGDFALVSSLLKDVAPDITDSNLQSELSRVAQWLTAIADAFIQEKYLKAGGLINNRAGLERWLAPHALQIAQVNALAQERESARQRFAEAVERGKAAFKQARWDDAQAAFQEAQRIRPEDESVRRSIKDCENERQRVQKMRAEVAALIGGSREHIEKGMYAEARQMLARAESAAKVEPLLTPLLSEIVAARSELDAAVSEQARREAIRADLARIEQVRARGDLQQALQALEQLLAREPSLPAALQLRADLRARVQEHELAEALSKKIQAVVQRLVTADFSHLDRALQELQHAATGTPHERDCSAVALGVTAAQRALQKGNLAAAAQEARALSAECPLVSPHAQALAQFAGELDRKHRAQLELDTKVRNQLDAIVRLLVSEDWKELSHALDELRNMTQRSSYQAGCAAVVQGVELVSKALSTGDLTSARKHLLDLQSSAQLLRPFEEQLRQFEARLTERQREAEAEALAREGLGLVQSKRWAEAAAIFAKAVERRPGDPNLARQLGYARRRAEDFTAARDGLRAGASRVDGLLKKGNWNEVIETCEELLRADYSAFLLDVEVNGLRAKLKSARESRLQETLGSAAQQLADRKFDEAYRLYRQVLEWDPQSVTAGERLREIDRARKLAEDERRREAEAARARLAAAPAVAPPEEAPTQAVSVSEAAAAIGAEEPTRAIEVPVEEEAASPVEERTAALPAQVAGEVAAAEAPAAALIVEPAPNMAERAPPRAAVVHVPAAPKPRRWWLVAAPAAAAVLVVVLLVLRPWRGAEEQAGPAETPASTTTVQPSVSPPPIPSPTAAPAVVGVAINALPWARAKIVPMTSGIAMPQISEDDRLTPCYLMLPEGEYRIELSNDGVSRPLVDQIRVQAGKNNSFLFTMPAHDPARIVAGLR
ncbi:MAG: protein kinase [Acidobacteriota bacterium]